MHEHDLSRRHFARLLGAGAAAAALPQSIVGAATPQAPVLLNGNENPLGPSPAAIKAMAEALPHVFRYPSAQDGELEEAIARHHGVSTDEVLLGNGSSDILRLAAGAYAGKKVVTAAPTFEVIAMHTRTFGGEVVAIQLDRNHAHNVERMSEAAKSAGLVYVCNPNNPTATITPKARMRALLDSVTAPLLVDEAYHHYATSSDYESVAPLVKTRPNLIVARTFSKVHALAGVRVGYALANRATITALRAQQAFNVPSLLGCVAARAALLDEAHVARARKHNSETRAWLAQQLHARGLAMLPSEANFVMIDLRRDVRPVIATLREQGVRVGRPFAAMPNHLRVTIGLREEMERFVTTLARTLAPA
ncbi:MAG TPA: aminotransferase class I/II-fold pyridoxal phosphate-dependent enzyme [Thermoanaerobaculia bacterium]|jgi:histidinol-phosphate aminotransferase